ncbi:hypothetical protein EW026_g4947 [Hermanssonia centrifuga]|uniref:Uncharacterized protein n=1 Tax=Hermanssonia centrifuga TaxID=98765 RepID=A0A4S4KFN3_9APHY|nr:hypothetical protein EW026_g4947 [Hermanssonia centrifuga]
MTSINKDFAACTYEYKCKWSGKIEVEARGAVICQRYQVRSGDCKLNPIRRMKRSLLVKSN